MIQKLYRHLTLLFTCVTSLILFFMLCIAWFYQITWADNRTEEAFRNQMLDLKRKLEMDSEISDSWLARVEAEGRFLIYIEENGRPLFFNGAWKPETPREILISRVREQAIQEDVDLSIRPFSFSSQESSVFSLKGDGGDTYLGGAAVMSRDRGFCGLILLLDTTAEKRSRQWQGALYISLELLGTTALFLVSRRLMRRAIRPVEEYHRKQTEFVAAASHELRSPLSVIQTCATAITTVPEQTDHMAELIGKECIRAGRLVKNLLFLASLDKEEDVKRQWGQNRTGGASKMERVEADGVLLQLLETYEPLCESRGIRLRLKLPEDILPPVYGNAQWIYQVLAIFLDNAMAYGCPEAEKGSGLDTPGKHGAGKIEMSACQKGGRVFLSVCDHGPGIPDEWKDRVFERFSRMDPSRKDKEHFGLGLGIAVSLARSMKAELEAADTDGGGCTFRLAMKAGR